jgi:adenylate kinase family enzyme
MQSNDQPQRAGATGGLHYGFVVLGLVIHLDCDAPTVAGRLRRNTGGDRVQRTDDTDALVARKLAIFREHTQLLLDHYRRQAVPVLGLSVNVESQPPELAREIEMWLKADLPSPRLTGKVEG